MYIQKKKTSVRRLDTEISYTMSITTMDTKYFLIKLIFAECSDFLLLVKLPEISTEHTLNHRQRLLVARLTVLTWKFFLK